MCVQNKGKICPKDNNNVIEGVINIYCNDIKNAINIYDNLKTLKIPKWHDLKESKKGINFDNIIKNDTFLTNIFNIDDIKNKKSEIQQIIYKMIIFHLFFIITYKILDCNCD